METNNWMFWAAGSAMLIAFLYYRVWPFARKIIRAFGGIRLKVKSDLSDEQYKKLAVGSLYALQQSAYLNVLTLDIDDKLPTILGHWWGISTPRDARDTLESLCQKGFDYYFPFVYEAFLLGDEEQQDQIFQQHMTSQEDYDKAVEQLYNLKATFQELLDCGVVTSKEDLERYGVVGWDAGRINFVARACYDAGHISETEAWKYIDRAYNLARGRFSSWHDLAMSYIIGRALWGGTGAYNSGMKSLADDLLSKPNSPWVQLQW